MRLALLLFTFTAFFYWKYAATQEIPSIHDGEHDDLILDENEDSERSAQAPLRTQTGTNVMMSSGDTRLSKGAGPSVPNPLECYVCTDCPKVLMNTTYKQCPFIYGISKQKKCVVYAEQYRHMNRPWYIRGCASERGSCADIKQAHASHSDVVSLISCVECEGNRCNVNGVTRSLPDFAIACFGLLIFPIVTKFTLP